jgi:hypothetical protein
MIMQNRALVYTVLAISLGYLLVSMVPNKLAPPMFSEFIGDSELLKAPRPDHAETPTEDASAPGTEPNRTFSGDAAEAQRDVEVAGSGSGNLVISVFETWSVNLLIALGVYLIARRKFS